MKGFQKVFDGGFILERLQDNIGDATRDARRNPQNKGHAITGVALPGGPGTTVRVDHKLGRVPQGYYVMRVTAASAKPYQFEEASSDENSVTLTSVASGSATFDMWFY